MSSANTTPASPQEAKVGQDALQKLFTDLLDTDVLIRNTAKRAVRALVAQEDCSVVLQQSVPFLLAGISHDEADIAAFTLLQMAGFAANEAALEILLSDSETELYRYCVQSVFHDTLEVSEAAKTFLLALNASAVGRRRYARDDNMLRKALLDEEFRQEQSVNWFRVLSIDVDIAVSNSAAFAEFHKASTTFKALSTLLSSDDVLLQLNALELVGALAGVKPGLELLGESNIVGQLLALMEASLDDPLATSLLFPGLLKLFHRVWDRAAQFDDFSIFFSTPATAGQLLTFFETCLNADGELAQDPTIVSAALTAVGGMAQTELGLLFLCGRLGSGQTNVVMKIPHASASRNPERLHALAAVLTYVPSINNNSNSSSTTGQYTAQQLTEAVDGKQSAALLQQSVFLQLGVSTNSSTVSMLLALLRLPFEELVCATLHVLQAALAHTWAAKLLSTKKQLFDYLLNRKRGYTSLVVQWRYKVVEAVLRAPEIMKKADFPAEMKQALFGYGREGPYSTQYEAKVMPPKTMAN